MELYLSNYLKKLPVNIKIDLYIYDYYLETYLFKKILSNDYKDFEKDDYVILSIICDDENNYEIEVVK